MLDTHINLFLFDIDENKFFYVFIYDQKITHSYIKVAMLYVFRLPIRTIYVIYTSILKQLICCSYCIKLLEYM